MCMWGGWGGSGGGGQVAAKHAGHPSSPEHLELNPLPPSDGLSAQADRFITHVSLGLSAHTHTNNTPTFIIPTPAPYNPSLAQIGPILSQSTPKGQQR